MNTEKKDHMKNDRTWKAVHEAFDTEVPEHFEKQFQKNLGAFRQDLREHPYVRRLERYGFPLRRRLIFFSRPWVRPLLLASTGLAIVVVVGFSILGNNPPTWAEVQERFGSSPFFSALMYTRHVSRGDKPLIEPRLVQIWGGYGDRMRIRSGSKVTFVHKGEILNTFDLIARSEADTDSVTYAIVNKIGKSCKNALESFLMPFKSDLVPESISREWKFGEPVDTTSLVISDPVISKDIVVFDHEYFYFKAKTGRARVWALRESRLPIRVVVWPMDDFNGRLVRSPSTDIIITYSKEQPTEFFSPEAFAAKLRDPTISKESLLYMFYQYPGGDSIPSPGS